MKSLFRYSSPLMLRHTAHQSGAEQHKDHSHGVVDCDEAYRTGSARSTTRSDLHAWPRRQRVEHNSRSQGEHAGAEAGLTDEEHREEGQLPEASARSAERERHKHRVLVLLVRQSDSTSARARNTRKQSDERWLTVCRPRCGRRRRGSGGGRARRKAAGTAGTAAEGTPGKPKETDVKITLRAI